MTKKTRRIRKELCVIKTCLNEVHVLKHGLCRSHANQLYADKPLIAIKAPKRREPLKEKLKKMQ